MKILIPENRDEILEFEKANPALQSLSDLERDLHVWNSRWRPEQLDHYLQLGWSFGVWQDQGPDAKSLLGYFLAQPILFFEGVTQTLWVEHLAYRDEATHKLLIELAYRYSRDKSLQRVLFAQPNEPLAMEESYQARPWQSSILEVKTRKY